MEKPKDYYSILGVPRDASPAAIRSAYRRLARRLRPETGAGEAFHDVQQAYDVLSDAEQRRHYDQSLREPQRRRGRSPAWTLDEQIPGAPLRRPVQPVTVTGEILLSPEEARAGGSLTLDIAVPAPCPACGRTGGPLLACYRCRGRGRIERHQPLALRIPAGVRPGAVFHVRLDEPDVHAILLTVHLTPLL